MHSPALTPIEYDYSPLLCGEDDPDFIKQTGLAEADLAWLEPRLLAARQEVLDELDLYRRSLRGATIPADKTPLDAAFFDLPERLLGEEHGTVEAIQQAADRLAEEVDRVVVLGIGGSYMGARAMFEACCHPYHNELSRERRGGRPRLSFEGNNVDNDAVQGLLDLIEGDDDWAVVVVSKSGATLETAAALRVFLDALRHSLGGDPARLGGRVIPITGEKGRLRDLAAALGCPVVFSVPEGVGGRFSVLSAVGLLPAAILGLDIVALLEGAAAMNQRFLTAPPRDNPPLAYAGLSRLMETRRGQTIRVMATWGSRLEAVGLWYDQLLAESLGKNGLGATPLLVVNTRDLHSRGQQHQQGRRDKLITNLVVEGVSREPVPVPTSDFDQDDLNKLAGKTFPEIMQAAFEGTSQAYHDDHRRTAAIRLPRLDEASLGQLFQMLMLATVVEGRLVGINPYGQPGVEAYKKHMDDRLRGG
jgi:glucose-6-phosphate isomerase